MARSITAWPQGSCERSWFSVIAEDYLDDAARVTCPVTMVWGERDKPAPLAAAERALEFFPSATLRVVSGAEHLLEGTLEQEVASAVADALRD
jgi:pimeloyl-ACP methyl ester carboxylesterase